MNRNARKQDDLEKFIKLYPSIDNLLNQVNSTAKITDYEVNGVVFQIRYKNNIVEMGLPIESPIFPTLIFKRLPNHQVELLHYRIGEEFKDAIYQVTEKYDAN